jgi:hypothetical protein
MNLTQEKLLSLCISFSLYFVVGFFGAFMKDLYDTLTLKDESIHLKKVLIGAFCTAFIFVGFEDTLSSKISLNLIVLLNFICGVLGFELFSNLTTISKFEKLVERLVKLRKKVKIVIRSDEEIEKLNDDKKK